MRVATSPTPLDAEQICQSVEAVLTAFLADKRTRPLLCVLGWYAGGGTVPARSAPVLRVAASLEMFHAFALIHDDLMDGSDRRRGRPTVHRALATLHRSRRGSAAEWLGISAAILVGDLALAWSDELPTSAALHRKQCATVLPIVHTMRTEIVYGQSLDMTTAGQPTECVAAASQIARYKTAKYTVERPLQVGAALAGGSERLLRNLSEFALPLGEAFQLRDDLLGAFGDPERTGKPVLDEVRQGKHTVLIACALQRAAPGQRRLLRELLGDPSLGDDQAARIRSVLEECGARQAVEAMIRDRHQQALDRLEQARLTPAVAVALEEVARAVQERSA
ncbi:polyprenyl synthetase family protein [Streptomyces sp. NPDC001635]